MRSGYFLYWIAKWWTVGVALLCTALGCLLFFFTEAMLNLTTHMERGIGAYWLPTERTFRLYQGIGIFFLCLGAALFGYFWYKP